MTAFDNYSKHLKNSSVPLLGMLSWYSVPESAQITHKDYLVLVETSGAPMRLPELPASANLFRRACNAAKVLKVPSPIPGQTYNYELRDAGYDDNFVFRSLVEELVDGKQHSHGYTVLAQVIFAKESLKVTFNFQVPDDHHARPICETIKQSIVDYVYQKGEVIPAITTRQNVQRALEGNLRGTRVRPGGGVYFVGMDKAKQIEAIDYVVNNVPDASFHILPLVDDTKQRAMLKSSFEDDSVEQTRGLIEDITELLKSGDDISARKFKDIQSKYTEQKKKLDEYQKLLSDALSRSATELDVCQAQLVTLLDRAT